MKRYDWKQNEVAYCVDCSPEEKGTRRLWHNFFGHGMKNHWHKSDTPEAFKEKSKKPFIFFQHDHKTKVGHKFYRTIHRSSPKYD